MGNVVGCWFLFSHTCLFGINEYPGAAKLQKIIKNVGTTDFTDYTDFGRFLSENPFFHTKARRTQSKDDRK